MSFGRIKLDPNDVLFSKMIRERDGACVFCGRKEGMLQNSHFWGRGNKTTRFSALNCDTLCFQDHANNEGNKQGFYMEWKMKQLGEKVYNELAKLARMTGDYGAWEKEMINQELKRQYQAGEHLKPGWVGIVYRPGYAGHCALASFPSSPSGASITSGSSRAKEGERIGEGSGRRKLK